MKIIDKAEKHSKLLNDIEVGDVFKYENNIFIKANNQYHSDIGVINLLTGMQILLPGGALVTPVDAALVINN